MPRLAHETGSPMCNYQGHEFGAQYPDSVCVDGWLFDADYCDDAGNLYGSGDDHPCPQCNRAIWREWHGEGVTDGAWVACDEGRWPFRLTKGGALWGFWRQILGVSRYAFDRVSGRLTAK